MYFQAKLPLDLEILIPTDDPVRLLSAFLQEFEKISVWVHECKSLYCIKVAYQNKISLHTLTLKRMCKKLYKLKNEEQIVFVYGIG